MKKIRETIRNNRSFMKAGLLATAAVVCTVCLYLSDNAASVMTNENGQNVLKRGQQGEDVTHEMEVQIGESEDTESIEVTVAGKAYDTKELRQAFVQAGEELEQLILGENPGLDEVRYDLDLITEIPQRGMSVSWETDRYDVVDMQGCIQRDAVPDEGINVKLTAVLAYGEEKSVREFYIRVFPPVQNEEEYLLETLGEELRQSDEETRTEQYLVLPDRVNGQTIHWKYGKNTRAFGVLILGLGGSLMIIVSASQRKKEEEKKTARQMQIDYPQIINKFNLYIRAGMTIRRAWFCIAEEYEKRRGNIRRQAYEEMMYTMYQIRGGAPEGECYEAYGSRCRIPAYRKFGTLLSQNLRKGSKGLTELLGREAQEAFEDRKNLAKKLGEEAGTKLMIPMFLMLIIVFAIVIVPAFFSIQI